MILDKIIRKMYPNVVNISFEIDGSYSATDSSGNTVTLDSTAINNEYDSQQYARDRAEAYPSLTDQLDDIFHNGIDGWKATIQVTKDKYPKE